MNRCQRNNNPGNLRFASQKEATGQDDKGFAIFLDAPAGFRALHAQIELDRQRGLTVKDFIGKYAPPSENNTTNYLNLVCTWLRCKEDMKLTEISKYALGGCIAGIEGFYVKEA
jgi:hypothetical protein